MTTVTNDGCILVIDDNRISLPAAIESAVQVAETVVVLLDPDGNIASSRNIWGFNSEGTRRWKAEALRAPAGDTNCYVDVWCEGTTLCAADWKGTEYSIDPQTGKHISTNFRK